MQALSLATNIHSRLPVRVCCCKQPGGGCSSVVTRLPALPCPAVAAAAAGALHHQALSEPASFAGLAGADELQQAVLGKQLVSFNTALGVVHEQQ